MILACNVQGCPGVCGAVDTSPVVQKHLHVAGLSEFDGEDEQVYVFGSVTAFSSTCDRCSGLKVDEVEGICPKPKTLGALPLPPFVA